MNETDSKESQKQVVDEKYLRTLLRNHVFDSNVHMVEYAKFFGVSEAYLSLYINNHRNIPAKLMERLGIKKKVVYEIDIDESKRIVRNVQ